MTPAEARTWFYLTLVALLLIGIWSLAARPAVTLAQIFMVAVFLVLTGLALGLPLLATHGANTPEAALAAALVVATILLPGVMFGFVVAGVLVFVFAVVVIAIDRFRPAAERSRAASRSDWRPIVVVGLPALSLVMFAVGIAFALGRPSVDNFRYVFATGFALVPATREWPSARSVLVSAITGFLVLAGVIAYQGTPSLGVFAGVSSGLLVSVLLDALTNQGRRDDRTADTRWFVQQVPGGILVAIVGAIALLAVARSA